MFTVIIGAKGLASTVLSHLVGEARRLGYIRLVLETGCKEFAAMRLYEARGRRRIPPFGEHVNDPTSVTMSVLSITLPGIAAAGQRHIRQG